VIKRILPLINFAGGTMTSTNEDVTVLAMAPLGDDLLLVMRHLPDRETIELGWWSREEGGAVMPGRAGLELAAEAIEVEALAGLCQRLTDARWDVAGNGETLAETAPLADGVQIAVMRSEDGIVLIRRPDGGDLALPSRAAFDLLGGMLPVARQKLETFGFGMIQQEEPGSAAATVEHR
jgi:hypothetical protein